MQAAVEADLHERLRTDTPFFAENCVKIIDKAGHLVPLAARPAQLRFDAKLEGQRLAGAPMRIICLKARQLGFSTWTQAKILQRVTQTPNHPALTVAQDRNTAGNLLAMVEVMYANLPDDDELAIKPPIRNRARRKELVFGEKSRGAREAGNLGINSSILVDTAAEFEAGRGFTYRSLHLSEAAFWPDLWRKLTGLLQTVPDEPGTLVVIESTANGFNEFKDLWDKAEAGENDYIPFFAAWHEDPAYRRPFMDEVDREAFVRSIGTGPYGDDEVELIEQFGLEPEQLHWRRWAIQNKCGGEIEVFHQEFPSTAEEAFVASGRQVFNSAYIRRAMTQAREFESNAVGELSAERHVQKRTRYGSIPMPVGVKWSPRSSVLERGDFWLLWAQPVPRRRAGGPCGCVGGCERCEGGVLVKDIPAGQYVVAVDPAKGDEQDDSGNAYHAIEVIDHRTRVQVAEYRSLRDPDLIAEQAYLAAVYFNRAWLAIETTGGYGLSMAHRIYRDWGYPRFYLRKSLEDRREKQGDRLGWDTNRTSKPVLEDGMREMLREGTHGVRSLELAKEMTTYVRFPNGRTGPEKGKHSDRLMAYMIAQQVAQEKPLLPDRRPGDIPVTSTRPFAR